MEDRATLDAYLAAYSLMEAGDPGAREAFARIEGDGLAAVHRTRLERGETGVEFEP